MSELLARQKGRLRLLILWLLYQSPKRGIDIIDDIYKMSWGMWRPSPGSVYPLLNKLLEEGAVRKEGGDRYQITDKGIKEIEHFILVRNRSKTEDAIEELQGLLNFFKEINREELALHKENIIDILKKIEEVIRNA
ncbi:PadR family transcriptional regulator [Sulfolobus acidocaldarius SUSAZ]|nr:PadR family transcriptional regulator [Sulfolobus acidocaldarius SUSAZ]